MEVLIAARSYSPQSDRVLECGAGYTAAPVDQDDPALIATMETMETSADMLRDAETGGKSRLCWETMKKQRQSMRLAQWQLAETLGVAQSAICRWERLQIPVPRRRLRKLADVLGLPFERLRDEQVQHFFT